MTYSERLTEPRPESCNQQYTFFLKELGVITKEGHNFKFWGDCLVDCRLEDGGRKMAGEFIFPQEFHPLERLSIIAAPHPDKGKTADVIFLRRLSRNRILLYFGDGVKPCQPPYPKIVPLLEKHGCSQAADAFAGILLRENPAAFRDLQTAADLHLRLESLLQKSYSQAGISPEELELIPNSQLPSIIGVACILELTEQTLDIAAIGDPVAWGIDPTGLKVASLFPPFQNPGIAELVKFKINQILKTNPEIKTVAQAKATQEYQE